VEQLNAAYQKKVGGNTVLGTLSDVWVSTVATTWKTIQFGPAIRGVDPGERAYCHMLEMISVGNGQITPEKYRAVAGLIGLPTTAAANAGVFEPPPDQADPDKIEWREVVVARAACGYANGAWVPQPGFRYLNNQDDAAFADACRKQLEASSAKERYDVDLFNLAGDEAQKRIEPIANSDDPSKQLTAAVVSSFALSFGTASNGLGVLLGLVCLVVVLLFIRVLAPLIIGVLYLQVALILLLMALPISIALLLTSRGRRGTIGGRMLRLTGVAMCSQLIFMLAMSMIMLIIGVGSVVAASLTTPGPGTIVPQTLAASGSQVIAAGTGSGTLISQLIIAVLPFLALLATRQLFKMVGLGDIFKIGDALGFITNAAAAATGDRTVQQAGASATAQMKNMPVSFRKEPVRDENGNIVRDENGKIQRSDRRRTVGDMDREQGNTIPIIGTSWDKYQQWRGSRGVGDGRTSRTRAPHHLASLWARRRRQLDLPAHRRDVQHLK
jgi:hypothetical protein